MNAKSFLFVFVASVLSAAVARAATITNVDAAPQTVVVYSDERADDLRTMTIGPSGSVEINTGICKSKCVIRLANGDEYEFELGEDLSIDAAGLYGHPIAQGSSGATDQNRQ